MDSTSSFPPDAAKPLAQANLPPRVHASVESYLKGLSTELATPADLLLWSLEAHLQHRVDAERGGAGQAEALAQLGNFRRRRAQWLPRLLAVIEAELAEVRTPVAMPELLPAPLEHQHLSLVDHAEMEQEVVLGEIVRKLENQHASDLHLLGQRFGVLAGAPAFGFERIPAGPQSLMRALRLSADELELEPEARLELYRQFDQTVLREYDHCLQLLNSVLSSHGVLPGLVFRPYRGRVERAERLASETTVAAAAPAATLTVSVPPPPAPMPPAPVAIAPAAAAPMAPSIAPPVAPATPAATAPAIDPTVLQEWFEQLPPAQDEEGHASLEQLRTLLENLARTDAPAFEQAQRDVQDALRQAERKAELAERRHIQAAQGRDRLETAKLHATQQIEAALELRQPAKFVQTLLRQTWADVLALVWLRHGEDSPTCHDVALLTDVLAAGGNPSDPALAPRVQRALLQVGYHGDEAADIAEHLSGLSTDALARTSLLVKLKYRARLGESDTASRPETVLDAAARECREKLGALPFGTWLELDDDDAPAPRQLRLSWHSATTGQALLVDAQGQRGNDHDLDELAQRMAQGRLRIAARQDTPLLDAAWTRVLANLRKLHGEDA